MKIRINTYPYNKDFAFCITIDDLHPESKNNLERLDFGSEIEKNPLLIIARTLRRNPQLKCTLFTVADWIDRSDFPSGIFFPLRKIFRQRRKYPTGTFDISQNKGWVKKINNFFPENIEIAYHGLNHHTDNKQYARSQEFGGLTLSENWSHIRTMMDIFSGSKIHHTRGFRPPGWFISKSLFEVLKHEDIAYIASTADMDTPITLNALVKKTKDYKQYIYKETIVNDVVTFTANCYPYQIDRAVEIAKQKGILMVHCHIAKTEWGLVTLVDNFQKNIERMIREITFQTICAPWFATVKDLADFIIARDTVIWKVEKNGVIFTNNSDKILKGLTTIIDGKTYIIEEIKPRKKYKLSIAPEKITISIVLTVYNGEETVRDSLDSLCKQSYTEREIIVVDDGSTDRTYTILKQYKRESGDENLIIIRQKNHGRAYAKNAGLKKARGDIVTFCEDDAIYSKEYVSNAIKHFSDKNTLGVIGPHYVWNAHDSLTTKAKDLERRRNFYNYKPFSAWFYRTKDLRAIGGFNERLPVGEDVEPVQQLRKIYPKKQLVFEPKSIWLHREPAYFKQYLQRKFNGGVGMALMRKMGIKKQIIPTKFVFYGIIFFAGFIIVFPFFIGRIWNITIFVMIIICFMLLALLVRIQDIRLARTVSNESLSIIILSIFIEYIWWITTAVGIVVGTIWSEEEIRNYFRGK